MDEPPPPSNHVLRPHHIGILTILMLTFKEYENKSLAIPFLLHVYRVLLKEVSEITEPRSWEALLGELSRGPTADKGDARHLIEALKDVHNDLKDADMLTNFFHGVSWLFLERGDEEVPTFTRRSLFGYFCRRCFITFVKLSFSGIVKLQRDYQAWRTGDAHAGYEPAEKDKLNNDTLIFKTKEDKKQWAQPDSYAAFEKARAVGNENEAVENLRRFFEQHFHESNDSGFRQHALLNLVRTYYVRHETAAARQLLQEAIAVARTSGDRLALQHCVSMLHRLPQVERGRKPMLNVIQPDLHPFEVLFDVKKLMQLQSEQPLTTSIERIAEAVGLYDQWIDGQGASPVESEQWGQHAVQSVVWTAAVPSGLMTGCNRLGDIEENIVMAFTEVAGDDNNRVTILLNRAYKLARQGKYVQALVMLLDPNVWRGLVMSDYELWANEIWHIMVLRASRRGQHRLYREYLKPRRPYGVYNPRDYFFNMTGPPDSVIRDPLHEVLLMRQCGQGTTTIEQLLTSLWHSEFQCRYGLYRTGIILLADVGLEFGMSKRSRAILEEIMPQLINGDDLEQRALACFTLARCIIAAGDSFKPSLEEAVPYLIMSENDFATLEIFASLSHVQYFLSVVYHNLGQIEQRNAAAARQLATEAKKKEAGAVAVDEEVQDIWRLVADVGATLSLR